MDLDARNLHDLSAPILIVEDDVDAAMILSLLLERRGFATVTCYNGHEALTYLRESPPPRLILSDLHMPIVDGYDLQQRVRESAALRRVPVIVMTDSRAIDRDRLGATPVLAKPLTVQTLVALVRECAASGGVRPIAT